MFELRPIPGYEGLYAVTQDGRVWSQPRVVVRRNGVPMTVRGRWMKPILRDDGYHVVTVHRGAEQRHILVHRAVAAAWLPVPAEDQNEVNHKDAVRTHNGMPNIEWCTRLENVHHAIAMGRMRYRTPARRAAQRRLALTKRKLSAEQAQLVRHQLAAGASCRAIAQQLDVAWLTVARIKRGETYQPQSEGERCV